VQPYVKYESQRANATVLKQVNAKPNTLGLANSLRSSSRFGIGVNYFLSGHGANIKLLHEFVFFNRAALDPTTWESASTNELTLQFQYFTF
jgi:hypothetical protein